VFLSHIIILRRASVVSATVVRLPCSKTNNIHTFAQTVQLKPPVVTVYILRANHNIKRAVRKIGIAEISNYKNIGWLQLYIYILRYTFWIIHFTFCNLHHTLCIIHYVIHFTWYILHYIFNIIYFTLYILHNIFYIIYFTLYILHYIFFILYFT
jgi:hypothetical protein